MHINPTKRSQIFFIDETFYLAVLALSKLVILAFFLRIFPNPWFRRTVYATMAFVAVSALTFIFLQIFQCLPISYNWDSWKGNFGEYRCINVNTLTFTAASFAILQDVIILVLPLPLLIGLQTSWRKKTGIIVMFSLGAFVLLTSCIRLRYLVEFARSQNPTWDYVDALLWTALEVNVSMIVASLPAIRALLVQTVPKVFGTTMRSKGAASGNLSSPRELSKHTKNSASRSKLASVFSTRGSRIDDDNESQLELGDRAQGVTQTEIAVDYGQADDRSVHSSEIGIHVQTTTTMSLNGWQQREKAER